MRGACRTELSCVVMALACGCGSGSSHGAPADAAPFDSTNSSDVRADDGMSAAAADDGSVEASASDDGGMEAASPDAAPAGPTIGGCPMFPPDYPYNVDISGAALDPGSATYIANLTARAGAIVAEYPGGEYVNVIPESQADVAVQTAAEYGFDLQDAFYQNSGAGAVAPIPAGAVYENMTTPSSDHHLMVVEQGTC